MGRTYLLMGKIIDHPYKDMQGKYDQQMLLFAGNKLLIQSTCWVCGRTSTEDHHIIPQGFGGTDGPQVSLCGNDHTALHKLAFDTYLFELPTMLDTIKQVKIASAPYVKHVKDTSYFRLWCLAFTVFRAKGLVASDTVGKKTKFAHTFDYARHQKLKKLTAALGKTQAQTVDAAIDYMYQRVIGDQ